MWHYNKNNQEKEILSALHTYKLAWLIKRRPLWEQIIFDGKATIS